MPTTRRRPIRDAVHRLVERADMRRKPSQERGVQRVEQILDATERLLLDTGYDAMTTNHVAAEANVSIGSLYQFFKNKEALLHAVIERYRNELHAGFFVAPDQIANASPAALVDHFLNAIAKFGLQHSTVASVMLSANEDSVVGKAAAAVFQSTADKIAAVIQQRAPLLSAEQCRLYATVVQTAGRAVTRRMLAEHRAGRHELAEALLAESRRMQTAYFEALLREYDAGHLVPARPTA